MSCRAQTITTPFTCILLPLRGRCLQSRALSPYVVAAAILRSRRDLSRYICGCLARLRTSGSCYVKVWLPRCDHIMSDSADFNEACCTGARLYTELVTLYMHHNTNIHAIWHLWLSTEYRLKSVHIYFICKLVILCYKYSSQTQGCLMKWRISDHFVKPTITKSISTAICCSWHWGKCWIHRCWKIVNQWNC